MLNTAPLTAAAQIYTVTEQAAAGFDLSSLQCIDDLDNQTHPEFVTVDLAARKATNQKSRTPTQGLTSATCSFNNTRQSSITVVKNTLGGDATFQFSGPSSFAITTVGGTGPQSVPRRAAGNLHGFGDVRAGWNRSSTVCTDPTGDTTVAGGTATIKLGAGEDVTCTYTDTKLGAIQVSKHSLGGDATFSFTGPQNFQITTTSGAGGPFTLPDLPAGKYTISEAAPADWQLSGIVCTDPTNDSTTSGSTATIKLAAGEVVACTFTNTRQASVTVEKQTLGGDGTFAFTGSKSFSITTTAGNGEHHRVRVGSAGRGAVDRRIRAVRVDARRRLPRATSGARSEPRSPTACRSRPPQVRTSCARSRIPRARRCGSSRTRSRRARKASTTRLRVRVRPRTFSLVDNGSGDNSKAFTDLPAGDYTVTETSVRVGQTGITCSDVVEPDLVTKDDDRPHGGKLHRAPAIRTDGGLHVHQYADPARDYHGSQAGRWRRWRLRLHGSGPGVPTTFTITTSGADHAGSQRLRDSRQGRTPSRKLVPAGWDLAPPPIDCTVTGGIEHHDHPEWHERVTIALGTTGAVTDSVACEFVDIKRGFDHDREERIAAEPEAVHVHDGEPGGTTRSPRASRLPTAARRRMPRRSARSFRRSIR